MVWYKYSATSTKIENTGRYAKNTRSSRCAEGNEDDATDAHGANPLFHSFYFILSLFPTHFCRVVICFTAMNLQAITGQLFIVDGYQKGSSSIPGLWVQPPPKNAARGRGSDFLFIHLTLSGKAEETAVLSGDLIDSISRTFYRSSGGVTSALRTALHNANQQLLRYNVSGTHTPREGAITCAVLRQDELYTVQAGEAVSMIGRNFGLERFPAKEPFRITPLGRTSGLEIRYDHHRLQVGDTLLLLDPRQAHLPTAQFTDALIDQNIDDSLAELAQLVGNDSARLLLINFTDDMPTQLPEVAVPLLTKRGRNLLRPQPRRESRPPRAVPQSERQPQPVRVEGGQISEQLERGARRATSKAIFGLSKFTEDLADSLDKFRQPEETEPDVEAGEASWGVLALLSIIIPLIVGGVVTTVFIQRSEGQQLAALKQEMALNLGLAEQATSEAEARTFYSDVLASAHLIETQLRPGDSDVAGYRERAQDALDRMDGIIRLQAELLYEFPEEVELGAVVLQPDPHDNLFVLDNNSGIVYQLPLTPQFDMAADAPLVAIAPEQTVGAHVIGPITDMFWRPEGQAVTRDSLAALDLNGALLSYRPNFGDIMVASLGFASDWRIPSAVATYDERLYVLDNGAAQIWRYFPIGDQFEASADERALSFSEDPNLEEVVDFDLFGEDGSLVLLYGNGRIRYYDTRSLRRQWDESEMQSFDAGVAPLVAPTSVKFIGQGIGTSIFVMDTGSGRMVWLNTRAGDVLDQYRATDESGAELFFDVTDFEITPDFQQFFFVAGNRVYTAVER